MIKAYTGKTGSGKTFRMVKDVYKQWLRGVDIYSNTVLFYETNKEAGQTILENKKAFSLLERFRYQVLTFIFKLLKKAHSVPKRGLIRYFEDMTEILEVRNGIIIFDEGQELFEARNWEKLPFEFSNKLRQHRKHQLDLYVTTQNLGTIDINYRRLVQSWYHTEEVFALFGMRNPSLFSVHKESVKDIDQLYNTIDDLKVANLKTKVFFIHRYKRVLYDTLYDIGFRRFKTVWLEIVRIAGINRRVCLIIPKRWTLQQGRQQLLLQKFYCEQNR